MATVLRIMDANFNRAREALRVMEEAARFVLDDAALVGPIKALRHDLAAAAARVPGLDANRDTPGDVGVAVKAEDEMRRDSVAGVALAAGKRLAEAIRALEEYAKVLPGEGAKGPRGRGARGQIRDQRSAIRNSAPLPAVLESLRYRGYDLEQKLNRALATGRAKQWRVCVLITESLCPRGDWRRVAKAAVAGGADCLQLREKGLDSGELLRRTREMVKLCRPRGVSVIVNDRPDIALLGDADGVHVGQTDLPVTEVRRLVGRQLLVGVSTANLAHARAAQRDGADYCGVGPMFATTTKHKPVLAGVAYLREYLAWNKLPHLAIAGIHADNLPQLVAAGVKGIAVSSAVCATQDPRRATRALVRGMSDL